MKPIAHMRNGFPEKFGIPRQSGLADVLGRIVFEREYASPDAVRGLEEFSHIWLIWQFSENAAADWSPTVRPPRLGGNKRKGVFATRSPYRPNPIGLSCVELVRVERDEKLGPVLWIRGADMLDGTPIYDIKPYVPYADSVPYARAGFAQEPPEKMEVVFEEAAEEALAACGEEGKEKKHLVVQLLSQDPRPSYQDDPQRVYGMCCEGLNVSFKAQGGAIRVIGVAPLKK